MKKFIRKRRLIFAGVNLALCTTLALFFVSDAAFAGKPDKDPPLPGWIYYHGGSDAYKMTPDGKNVTPIDVKGEPSIRLHDGHRWILEFRQADPPAYYPNGYPRHDLYAVREDNSAICAQLTDEFDLEPDPDIYSSKPRELARWSLNDTRVSFLAKRWEIVETSPGVYVFSGEVAELGLYELNVDWDPVTFDPSGGPADLILDDLDLLEDDEPHMGFIGSFYDVSHDRLKVAYTKLFFDSEKNRYVHSVYISEVTDPEAGFGPGDPLAGAENIHGGDHRLSPDGTKVVFTDAYYNEKTNSIGLIQTVNTDGTGLMTVVTPGRNKGVGGTCWSSTGAHLIYNLYWSKNWIHYQELIRCEADGGGNRALTDSKDIHAYTIGWRGDD